MKLAGLILAILAGPMFVVCLVGLSPQSAPSRTSHSDARVSEARTQLVAQNSGNGQAAPRKLTPQQQAMIIAAAQRANTKLKRMVANSMREQPDQTPTVLSDFEVNSFVLAGGLPMPTGVKRVAFETKPGVINALAKVDFDEITASKRSSNPLLYLFRGLHDVHTTAAAQGSGGEAKIEVQTVEIDGVKVPRVALEYFVEHYVTANHPGVGLTTTFHMPDRIDLAIVGQHQVTFTQI